VLQSSALTSQCLLRVEHSLRSCLDTRIGVTSAATTMAVAPARSSYNVSSSVSHSTSRIRGYRNCGERVVRRNFARSPVLPQALCEIFVVVDSCANTLVAIVMRFIYSVPPSCFKALDRATTAPKEASHGQSTVRLLLASGPRAPACVARSTRLDSFL